MVGTFPGRTPSSAPSARSWPSRTMNGPRPAPTWGPWGQEKSGSSPTPRANWTNGLTRAPESAPLATISAGLTRLHCWHPSDRRQLEPGKITRRSGRRPSRVTRSALARDLARLHTGAPGGWPLLQFARLALIVAALSRCGGPRGRLARRRRRGPAGPKSGRRRPGAQRFPRKTRRAAGRSCATYRPAQPARGACQDRRPARARRAPRALEDVKIVITNLDNIRCQRCDHDRFRWSGVESGSVAGRYEPGNRCCQCHLILDTGCCCRWSPASILNTHAATMAAPVVLTGGLPGHTQPGGDLWPPDAQANSLVNQLRQCRFCPLLCNPGALDLL